MSKSAKNLINFQGYTDAIQDIQSNSRKIEIEAKTAFQQNPKKVQFFEFDNNAEADMNNDEYLKMFIEKMNADNLDMKEDFRNGQRNIEDKIRETEQRQEKRIEKIERMIEGQSNKLDEVQKSVNDKLDENKRFMWGIVITILLSIVASIGVIVATYLSTISLLQNML